MRCPTPFLALLLGAAATVVAQEPAAQAPVNHSFVAFTIPEKDLLPESVAHDPETGAFYVGSTRKGKIMRVDPDGTVRDFVSPRAHGLWMAIGMKADPERRTLWVASTANGNLVDKGPDDPQSAGLFGFDLDTGALVARHVLDAPPNRFLNDLVVAPDGDVYVTHMFDEAAIWVLRRATGAWERFLALEGIRYPNGISLDEARGTLYVAHAEGVAAVDLASRELEDVTADGDADLGGIDGLYWHDGALVAIHPSRDLVARYPLDTEGRRVTGVDVIESRHPMFRVPTTGVLVGDDFVYVANAQFESFDEDGSLWPMERLYEVVVLRAPLRP